MLGGFARAHPACTKLIDVVQHIIMTTDLDRHTDRCQKKRRGQRHPEQPYREVAFGGTDEQIFFAAGAAFGGLRRGGAPASRPKVMTDITVRTKDGQEALWVIEGRRADWVQKRLTPVLKQAGIPYHDDVLPMDRTT